MPSDFLSNLSSRALQHSGVDAPGSGLQPRLASRFESMHAPAGLAVEEASEQEPLIEVDAGNDVGRRRPVTDRTPVEDRESVHHQKWKSGLMEVQEHRHEESKHSFENDGNPAVSDVLKPMPAADYSARFPQPFAPADAQQTELPGLVRNDANPSPRTVLPEIIERHTTIVEPSLTDPKQLTPASVPLLPPGQTKVVPERIEVTRIERQPQASPTGPQIVPSLELPARMSQRKMPESREQPPTIHVTIGRIEVKAAPPASAPKQRSPASPTMSLEEYLRRRSGGER
jgi:hypothetical protein